MTTEDIKIAAKQGNSSLEFDLYSEAFQSEMKQHIYVPTLDWNTGEKEKDIDKLVTPYITTCVNSFLNLKIENFKEELQNEFFRLFNIYIENTSYGQVPDELIELHGNTEANRIFFHGQSKEKLFENCRFDSVFYDNDAAPLNCFTVYVGIDWDLEHGLSLSFVNGELSEVEGS